MSKNTNSQESKSRRKFIGTISTAAIASITLPVRAKGVETSIQGTPTDLHICMGLNTQPTSKNGTVYQPGECECASAEAHACMGGNSCADLGACGTGGYARQYWATENNCGKEPVGGSKWNGTGGCGVPIGNSNTGFISTQLNNAAPTEVPGEPGVYYPTDFIGKPVWSIARSRFEKKMATARTAFGKPSDLPSPLEANTWNGAGTYKNTVGLPAPYPQPQPHKLPAPSKTQ